MITNLYFVGEKLGWALVHSIWQGVLIAILLAIGLRVVRGANWQHLLCQVAMTAMLCIVVITFLRVENSAQLGVTSLPNYNREAAIVPSLVGGSSGEATASHQSEIIWADASGRKFDLPLLLFVCAITWGLGFVFSLLRKLIGLRQLQIWKKQCESEADALPSNLKLAAERACNHFVGSARVAIQVCDRVASPVICGVIRPVILVPMSLVAKLSVHELEMILTHELAHWKRRDTWLQSWQLILESIFFYHPVIWWISRVADRTREEATDDLVLRCGTCRQRYAGVLAEVAAMQNELKSDWALAAAENHVAHRIRRFLKTPPPTDIGPTRREGWIVGLTVLLIAIIFAGIPSIAEPAKDALPSEAKKSGVFGEYILLVGGPTLISEKEANAQGLPKDKWWGNFVRAARLRGEEIQELEEINAALTLLVYRPAYERRSQQDNNDEIIFAIENVAAKIQAKLVWFGAIEEVIEYVNSTENRQQFKISGLEFFGHGDSSRMLFDYSQPPQSNCFLSEKDFGKLDRTAFAQDAFCKSWGSKNGLSFSREFENTLQTKMAAPIGEVDFRELWRGDLSRIEKTSRWTGAKGKDSGVKITSGVVSFANHRDREQLVIRQESKRAVIDFTSVDFSLSDVLIEADQPGSVTLVRIQNGKPTRLYKELKAKNTKISIINPNGIIVGPNGIIDVDQPIELSGGETGAGVSLIIENGGLLRTSGTASKTGSSVDLGGEKAAEVSQP